jgi:type IV conjugative transfer system protein TraL
MQYKRIPKHLNSKPQFLWWEVDDIAVFLIFLVIGLITNYLLISLVIGVFATWLKIKSKDTFVKGYFGHMFHWLGLMEKKGIPPGHIRRIIR